MGARTWIGSWPVYRPPNRAGAARPAARAHPPPPPPRARRAPRARNAWPPRRPPPGDPRQYQVLYRGPGGTEWEHLELDTAMDMIADRVIAARREGWQWGEGGKGTRRPL